MKGLSMVMTLLLTLAFARGSAQTIGAVVAWTTVPGVYTDNLGGQVTITTAGTYNHIIFVNPRRAHPNATYVDIPLIVHVHATGVIPAWNILAMGYEYDETKIDVAAAYSLGSGQYAPYWFSSFTGSDGSFSRLGIRFTLPEPMRPSAFSAGAIYPDQRPNIAYFEIGLGSINQRLPFYQDYRFFEAGTKGLVTTVYSSENSVDTRVPWTLRVYFRNIGVGNTYSPSLTRQNLAVRDFRDPSQWRTYQIQFLCQIEVLPRPALPLRRL